MEAFNIHEDSRNETESWDEQDTRQTGQQDELLERGCKADDEGSELYYTSDDEVYDESVADEMEKLRVSFKGISKRFRLIKRIGEGTFSTVYKAEDLLYDIYDNSWDSEYPEEKVPHDPPPDKRQKTGNGSYEQRSKRGPKYVAIKKIYVTSSPIRIQNELELLHDLRGYDSVCPLITAFRHQDQVVAVLPYFRHFDFREFFRDMLPCDMQDYFRSLMAALKAVHSHGILHRDIKPTNFLYDIPRRRGVLVDFGLAEREGTDYSPCRCEAEVVDLPRLVELERATKCPLATGYPKDDPRPSRRANRAGTRGFRAPEVLFKCTAQTTKIDIWSAGVILLTMLSRRFPFFNSTDDIEATIEIATIFGKRRMREAAALHGAVLHCTIPTIGDRGFSLDKIVLWSTGRTKRGPNGEDTPLRPDEVEAVDFLAGLLELDPRQRYSAEDALLHPFLADERELWEEYESEKIGRMRGDRWDTGWRRWWAAKWELEEERGVMEKEREWLEREDENEGELKTTGEEQVDRPMDGAAGVEDEVDML